METNPTVEPEFAPANQNMTEIGEQPEDPIDVDQNSPASINYITPEMLDRIKQ